MKKNILLVQSLFVLSFIATSPLLGGKSKNKSQRKREQRQRQAQNQKKFTYTIQEQPVTEEKVQEQIEQNKNNYQSALQELQNSQLFLRQSQICNGLHEEPTIIIENPLYNPQTQPEVSLVKSEVEVIDLPLPANFPQNDLSQSVVLPTEERELSFFEKLSYHTSTANQILNKVICELEAGSFDTKHKNSFDLLEEAIATATKNNDVEALATIAALCKEKYPTTIRISEKVAQPASNLLQEHYSEELNAAHNKLQNQHEQRMQQWNTATLTCMTSIINAINAYKQNVEGIHQNYNAALEQENQHITGARRDVSTFSCLNREIRPGTAKLLTENQLKTPHNIHAYTMDASEQALNHIAKKIETIATTKELQNNPKYIENLTNKCLTNK